MGYGSSQNLDLRFFSGNKSAPSKAPESFATPSPAELAERPWSIENIAGLYGDRVSARSTSDVLVLRPPSATLVLGATRNAPRPRTSPSALGALRLRDLSQSGTGTAFRNLRVNGDVKHVLEPGLVNVDCSPYTQWLPEGTWDRRSRQR